MDEWLTYSDIATLSGLKTGTIKQSRKRGTLPEPSQYVGKTPIWSKQVVDHWIATKRRKTQ